MNVYRKYISLSFPIDALSWVIPAVISVTVPLAILAMGKFSLTRDQTITATIKQENVQADLTEMKDALKEGFENQNKILDKKMEEISTKFDKMDGRLQDLEREWYNLKWRMEQMEKKIKNGGEKSAI